MKQRNAVNESVLLSDLTAIAGDARAHKDRRIAAQLLVRALTTDLIREDILNLMAVTGVELGNAVASEFEALAKQFGLLPSPRDRLVADLRKSS